MMRIHNKHPLAPHIDHMQMCVLTDPKVHTEMSETKTGTEGPVLPVKEEYHKHTRQSSLIDHLSSWDTVSSIQGQPSFSYQNVCLAVFLWIIYFC